jgi:hypothetical protein
MTCPGIAVDCDNPGCRHGGCQGRPPQRLRAAAAVIEVIASRATAPGTVLPPTGRPIRPATRAVVPELV